MNTSNYDRSQTKIIVIKLIAFNYFKRPRTHRVLSQQTFNLGFQIKSQLQ